MITNYATHCIRQRIHSPGFDNQPVNSVMNTLRVEPSVAHDIRNSSKLALDVRPAHSFPPRRGRNRSIVLVENGVNVFRSGIDKTLIGHVWHTLYQVFEFRLIVIDNPTKDIDIKFICIPFRIKRERRIRKSVNPFLGSHLCKEYEMNRIPHSPRITSPIAIPEIRQITSLRAT